MVATHGTGQSNAIEDYAKSIYSLQARAGGEAVSTNALAERCGVTPASASAMVKKLAERGLAIHEPYHGVRLTAAGERLALEMLRYISDLGICVGDELEVVDRQPFEGPCTVRFASGSHVLGLPLCRAMRVVRSRAS